MISICFGMILAYAFIGMCDEWWTHSNEATFNRIWYVLVIVLCVAGLLAANDAFAFPTDLRVIRERYRH